MGVNIYEYIEVIYIKKCKNDLICYMKIGN